MDALDGNAIAGQLVEVFGAEMTTATGVCASCGASGVVAELVVYLQAPGTVVRCRGCDSVLMVLVTARGVTCVDLRGLRQLFSPQP
jgi:hypothetical protein